MNEEEFDSLLSGRPFRREDWKKAEADAASLTTLALVLWGRTPDDLARQLAAPYPQIPPGCTIADLRRLQNYLYKLAAAASERQKAWLRFSSVAWIADSQDSAGLHDRLELVRRAIEHLEKR